MYFDYNCGVKNDPESELVNSWRRADGNNHSRIADREWMTAYPETSNESVYRDNGPARLRSAAHGRKPVSRPVRSRVRAQMLELADKPEVMCGGAGHLPMADHTDTIPSTLGYIQINDEREELVAHLAYHPEKSQNAHHHRERRSAGVASCSCPHRPLRRKRHPGAEWSRLTLYFPLLGATFSTWCRNSTNSSSHPPEPLAPSSVRPRVAGLFATDSERSFQVVTPPVRIRKQVKRPGDVQSRFSSLRPVRKGVCPCNVLSSIPVQTTAEPVRANSSHNSQGLRA